MLYYIYTVEWDNIDVMLLLVGVYWDLADRINLIRRIIVSFFHCIYCVFPCREKYRATIGIKIMKATRLSPRARLAMRSSFLSSQLRRRIAQSSRCGQKTFLMANLKINFACLYRWNATVRAHHASSLLPPPQPIAAAPPLSPLSPSLARQLLFSRCEISIRTTRNQSSSSFFFFNIKYTPPQNNLYTFFSNEAEVFQVVAMEDRCWHFLIIIGYKSENERKYRNNENKITI